MYDASSPISIKNCSAASFNSYDVVSLFRGAVRHIRVQGRHVAVVSHFSADVYMRRPVSSHGAAQAYLKDSSP